MQVDFSPLPATGEMAPAEMPPMSGRSRNAAPSAGGGRSDSGHPAGVGRQKGFRETMDDLLRAETPGKAQDQDAEISAKPSAKPSGKLAEQDSGEVSGEASEEDKEGVLKLPEGTLLEIAAQTAERLRLPTGNKSEGGPARQGEVHSESGLTQGDPDLKITGDSAKTASTRLAGPNGAATINGAREAAAALANKAAVASEVAVANKTAVANKAAVLNEATVTENAPNATSDPLKPEVLLSRQVEAGMHRDGASAQAGVPKGGIMPAESEVDRLTEGSTAVPKGADSAADGIRKGMDGSGRLSPTAAGMDAKAGPLAEGDHFASAQDGSGSQSLPKATPASAAALSATPEEGSPQSFASMVESLEKSGGGGSHLSVDADTSLDAVGPAGNKGHATSLSATMNAAKGEPAATQTLPKDEVVQQIVNSARLRLGSGQSEIRIQLKPEHLGRVRLNIATEQQQVVIKVVADLPMVKELLESNLHQLRTELQGQGLEIHKFDVSVGGDSGAQNREPQTWGQQPGGRRGNAFAQKDADQQEEEFGSKRHHPQAMASAAEGVDYFA